MNADLVCWKCGAGLCGLPQPLGRRAECPKCQAELHVCRMCRHYDPGKARHCREPVADDVQDKTRANFCDWFQARANAYQAAPASSPDTRGALSALFGDDAAPPAQSDAKSDLKRLFGK